MTDDVKVHIPIDPRHAIRMSNRQYSFLRYLREARSDKVTLEELSHLNQGTVGSAKRRQWLTESKGRDGVQMTHEGREALKAFEHGDFTRTVARMKFSSFLSLDVYDEGKSKPKGKPKKTAVHRKTVVKGFGSVDRQGAAQWTQSKGCLRRGWFCVRSMGSRGSILT